MKRDLRFATTGPDGSAAASRAEVLLMLSGGAVRSAVRKWVADGGTAGITDIEHRAVTLIREVLEKLQ